MYFDRDAGESWDGELLHIYAFKKACTRNILLTGVSSESDESLRLQ